MDFIENITISWGLGDFIAIDSYLLDSEKKNLKKVFIMERHFDQSKHKVIVDINSVKFISSVYDLLFKNFKNYNNNLEIKKIKEIECNEINPYYFSRINTFKNYFELSNIAFDFIHFNNIMWEEKREDYFPNFFKKAESIVGNCLNKILPFDLIKNRNHTLDSSFLKNNFCDIGKYNLPNNFVTLMPWTNYPRYFYFTDEDWKETEKILRHLNLKAVVIGQENYDKVPKSDRFINLIDKTNILESIEICKRSNFYIGVDSWPSVLVAQFLNCNKCIIKHRSENSPSFKRFKFYNN
jgi:hypothetical protein